MTEGFFSPSQMHSRQPLSLIPKCGACGLYRSCKSPKMKVHGEGRLKTLVVGEAPGEDEDQAGKPFVGKAGRRLKSALQKLRVDLYRDCWTTNALICRPPGNVIKSLNKIDFCRPNLIRTIEELKPVRIILLGGVAVQSLIPYLWKMHVGGTSRSGGIGRWAGWAIPSQKLNAWVHPTFHPSYVMREEEREVPNPVPGLIFERHLKRAFPGLFDRPWSVVPNYREWVQCILSPTKAAESIREFVVRGKTTAFDFETNCLKPDGPEAKIICCSLSDGDRTIAYPWVGEAVQATKEFLASDVPKVASNMKFEDRWAARKLGVRVKNWSWDTMLAAHWLDNRRDVTSIKFQSFVTLGMDSYNDHIEHLLKGEGGRGLNNVHKVDLKDLLNYCALDSLMEIKVAQHQQIPYMLGQGGGYGVQPGGETRSFSVKKGGQVPMQGCERHKGPPRPGATKDPRGNRRIRNSNLEHGGGDGRGG